MSINILDLFAGIGGFSLAIKNVGFNIDKHYASEIDKYAQQIYRKQFPRSVQLGDITGIGNEHGKIDIITGGFPCQAFSIAGKRRGFEDTRGTLFFDIERLAREYKPSYMVLENVKGLASHEGGNTIRIILDRLRRLDYSVQLLLLNTKDFSIPQNRERFAFICTLRGKRQPEVSRIRERKTETVGTDVTAISTRNSGLGGDEFFEGSSPCLTASGYKDMHKVRVKAVLTPDRVNKFQNGRRFKDVDEPSFTLTTQDKHGVYYDDIIRRYTPIETERLQNFPDNWTKLGIDEDGKEVEISDTQRYKCCGNSITVKPFQEIMEAIKKVYSD